MKENTLTVHIHKPIDLVFAWATDPTKTPLWLSSIDVEETDTWPIMLGTQYRNRKDNNPWSEYTVTALTPPTLFELTMKDGNYHVRYVLKALAKDRTGLTYHEWVDQGVLDAPFNKDTPEKFVKLVESKAL